MSSTRKEAAKKPEPTIAKFKPHLSHSKATNICVSDGRVFSIEYPTMLFGNGKKSHTVVIKHKDKVQTINMGGKIDSISPVPGDEQFLTCRSTKKGIKLALWDMKTEAKICQTTVNDPDLDHDGSVYIACTKNNFLLHYRSTDITDGQHGFIELRELKSLKKIAIAETRLGYGQPYIFPQHKQEHFFLAAQDGFEQWSYANGKLKHKDGVQFRFDENNTVSSLDMLMDGKTIVTGHAYGYMRFVKVALDANIHDKTQRQFLDLVSIFATDKFFHPDNIGNLAVMPDGKHLVTWDDKAATLWNIADMKNPKIVNKIVGNDSLGYGASAILDDCSLVTTRGKIICFPEITKPKLEMSAEGFFKPALREPRIKIEEKEEKCKIELSM